MRRFFLALGVRLQVVARPLPHVIELVQRPAHGVVRHPPSRGDFQKLLKQGDRPAHVRAAQVLGREGQEGPKQMLVVLVQRPMTPRPFLVPQRLGIMAPGVGPDPVVNALPGHPEHTGDVGRRAPLVELQDGQGAPQEAGIQGHLQLTPETASLPGGQVEPAHALLLDRCSGS
jgi:hypothetical protein